MMTIDQIEQLLERNRWLGQGAPWYEALESAIAHYYSASSEEATMQNEFASDLTLKERQIAHLITEAAIIRSSMYGANAKLYQVLMERLQSAERELAKLLK